MNKYAAVILYGLLCGAMLTAFSLITDLSKFIFSLVAFFAGIKFFRTYESIKLRVAFVVLSIVFYFLMMIIFTAVAIAKGWIIPGITDNL
jgi:lipopolysaccharide export LptBFGC system permease protein LptF